MERQIHQTRDGRFIHTRIAEFGKSSTLLPQDRARLDLLVAEAQGKEEGLGEDISYLTYSIGLLKDSVWTLTDQATTMSMERAYLQFDLACTRHESDGLRVENALLWERLREAGLEEGENPYAP